jgi:hypothetical protein
VDIAPAPALTQLTSLAPSASAAASPAPSERRPESVDFHQVDFNERVSNRDVNETATDRQILKDLGRKVRMHAEEDVSHLNGAVPSTTELQTEFDKLAADKDIPFKYITDGCTARAHLMCDEMHKDDVNCAKMWVMVDHTKNYLASKNEYLEADWHGFHVAPLVYARDEKTQQIEPYVMDPSVAHHPMRPQDWIHEIWDGKAPLHLDVTPDAQYGRLETFGRQTDFNDSLEPARALLDKESEVLGRIEKNS